MTDNDDSRFLFVSYATENFHLAEWLTLRLTALGYEVWCDQIKLLGGESYPRDIDEALEKSFRVLHLLSHTSKDKDNPVKERTKALSIGRARGIKDFLIPLNIDGLKAAELPWMAADITFIPFMNNWADGLTRLIKKLQSITAPKRRTDGFDAVRHYVDHAQIVRQSPEPIWSNLLDVLGLPQSIYRVRGTGLKPLDWRGITYFRNGFDYWTFEAPIGDGDAEVEEYPCNSASVVNGLPLLNPITFLVRKHIASYCLRKGLILTERARKRGEFYFPTGLISDNRLHFQVPGQRRRWVQPIGERTFVSAGKKEKSRYHLSVGLRPMLHTFDRPAIQVQVAVWLTDLNSNPLEQTVMNRRRKALCHYWFNGAWFARTHAVVSWLADGKDTFEVFRRGKNAIVLSGKPLALRSPVSLDESALKPLPDEDESEDIDEFAETEVQDEEDGELKDSDSNGA